MIPKTIHYAWFGPKEMPADMMRLIDGWRKVMPDYEFILWNESNFDVSYTPYLREAYASDNFAFVVDVVRFNVLYRYGGIYLTLTLRSLNHLTHTSAQRAFSATKPPP